MRPAKSRQNVRSLGLFVIFLSFRLKLAPVEEAVFPRALKVIDLTPAPFFKAYREPDVSRTNTTVSSGFAPVFGFAFVMVLSQLGFKNTIQPTAQSSPTTSHFGAERLVVDDIHMLTHILRLMASDRARWVAKVKSALIPRMALLETKVSSAGAASAVMMAKIEIVTNNSTSVKPEFLGLVLFMPLILHPRNTLQKPHIMRLLPYVGRLLSQQPNRQ